MLGRRFLAVVGGLALASTAGSAQADHETLSGVEPVVVAGPASDEPGDRLLARARGRDLCLQIADDAFGDADGAGSCGEIPRIDLEQPLAIDVIEDTGVRRPREPFARSAQVEQAETRSAGGAVRAIVHFVEYELAGGVRVRIPTAPAPAALSGKPAGELRYFLGALPPDGAVYSRRLLGPEGEVLGDEDTERHEPGEGRPPLAGPTRIARGRMYGGRWSITATVESRLHPARGDVTRRVRALCVHGRQWARDGSSGGTQCSPLPLEEPMYDMTSGCASRGRNIVYGAARAGDAPVGLVLGNGRRLRVRRVALPASLAAGDVAGFVAVAPRGQAIRSLVLPGGVREPLGLAPPAVMPCSTVGFFQSGAAFESGGPSPGGDVDVAAPGAPSLMVRDDGEKLCLAVGRTARTRECDIPGPWLASSLAHVSEDRRLAGGAVDPRVTGVRVRLSDGTTFDVTPHADDRYAGRYAGRLAFFSAAAPEGRHMTDVDLLDDRGKEMFPAAFVDRRTARAARPLLRARGAGGPFTIAAAPLETSRDGFEASCLFITRGSLPRAGAECHDAVPDEQWLHGYVACEHGATIVLVGLTRGMRRGDARLADGTRVPLVVRRAPRGERVGIVVVPATARIRRITLRWPDGRTRAHFPLRAPAASRQCGYTFFSRVGFE